MMKLKKLNMDPPGKWWFKCDDGFIVKAGHYEKLVRFVKDHYKANDQEIPENLEDLIQHQICLRVPASLCTGNGPHRKFPATSAILKGTRRIIKSFRSRKKVVPQDRDSQMQRMFVCVSCRMNQNRMGCFKCQLPYKLSAGAFGDLGNIDDPLRACDFFEATGLALTSAPDEVLLSLFAKMDLSEAPLNCWLVAMLLAKRKE